VVQEWVTWSVYGHRNLVLFGSAEQLSALLYPIQYNIKLDVTVNFNAIRWLTTFVTAGTSYIRADQSADLQVGLRAALGHLNSFRNTTNTVQHNRSIKHNMARELPSSGLSRSE
jgi:voltage-gated potassium channel Kch